jgi:hypothetical protein
VFDWFGKAFSRREYPTWKDVPPPTDMEKIANDMSKVIQFPELKSAPPPMPEVEKPAHTYYRLGLTDNNRVSLVMGYSEVTFNAKGVDNLIAQLEVFRDQLDKDEAE